MARRQTPRGTPALPVPTDADGATRAFFEGVKEHLEVARGDRGFPKARFVTLEELEVAGLITTVTRDGRAEIVPTLTDRPTLKA